MSDNDKAIVIEHFQTIFPDNRTQQTTVFAPGRINLIGEHTDYTGGLVMPAAIDRGTWITAAPNNSRDICIASVNFGSEIITVPLSKKYSRQDEWCDYLRGVLVELQIINPDDIETGFDAVVYGTIPNGAGLSSSASLEMALILTILSINGLPVPMAGSNEMVEMVLLAQRCENRFIGVQCGIMDQFIVANGKKEMAVQLDCSNLNWHYRPLNMGNSQFVIANTNKQRRLEESKYNERRSQCEEGFALLQQTGVSAGQLGQVKPEEWQPLRAKLDKQPLLQKRLDHVIFENERVREAAEALELGDIPLFADCLNRSGDSLRNLYEVTGNHLDTLVDAARSCRGVLAARMTGAGFGGCAVMLVETDSIEQCKKDISRIYSKKMAVTPDFYSVVISDGAQVV